MKNLRNVLVALAFIFAIGAAFATTTLDQNVLSKAPVINGQPDLEECANVTQTTSCSGTANPCDVDESGTIFRYYSNQNCVTAITKN